MNPADEALAQLLGDEAQRVTHWYVFHEDRGQQVALRVERIRACYSLHRAAFIDEWAMRPNLSRARAGSVSRVTPGVGSCLGRP